MLCPKCGHTVQMQDVICPGCQFILDTEFLGQDILDELEEHRPGLGGIEPNELDADRILFLDRKLPDALRHKSKDGFERLSEYAAGKSLVMVAPGAVPKKAFRKLPASVSPFQHLILKHIDGEQPLESIAEQLPLSLEEVRLQVEAMLKKKWITVVRRVRARPGPERRTRVRTDGEVNHITRRFASALDIRHPFFCEPLSTEEHEHLQNSNREIYDAPKSNRAPHGRESGDPESIFDLPNRPHPSQEHGPEPSASALTKTAIGNKKRSRRSQRSTGDSSEEHNASATGRDQDKTQPGRKSAERSSKAAQKHPQRPARTDITSLDIVPSLDTDIIDESMVIRSLHTTSGRPLAEAEDIQLDVHSDAQKMLNPEVFQTADSAFAALSQSVQNQDWHEAETIATRASQTWPGHPEFHNALGVVHSQYQNMDLAIVHFKKALVLAPKNKEYRQNLRQARSLQAQQPKQ